MQTSNDRGFVFAATGKLYVDLARRAARSLRLVMPEAQIDLFTDKPLQDEVFDRVEIVGHVSARPKIEALQRSRFARTVYVDADTAFTAPLDDLFEILDCFDIGLAAVQRRNDERNIEQLPGKPPVPVAFPQLNSGLIVIRRSARTDQFLTEWHARVHDGSQKFDQPTLRSLIYHGDLRVHVLPEEYNMMFFRVMMSQDRGFAAPRVLHSPRLHQIEIGDPTVPQDMSRVLTQPQLERIAAMLRGDQTIPHFVVPGQQSRLHPKFRRQYFWGRVKNWLRRTL